MSARMAFGRSDSLDEEQPLEVGPTQQVVTATMEGDDSRADDESAGAARRQEEEEATQAVAAEAELAPGATGQARGEESGRAPAEAQGRRRPSRLDADQVAHQIDAMFEEALQAADERLGSPAGGSQSSNCSDLAARSSSLAFSSSESPEVEQQDRERDEEEEEEEERLSEHSDDFCGEQASESTLRRLKMDAYEDTLVCGQNRQSMLMARRLFSGQAPSLAANFDGQEEQELGWRKLWSQASGADDSDEGHPESPAYDIKLPSRSASSASSLHNLRRTLVCSVSPTGELAELGAQLGAQQPAYPMDGDEIQQCRVAFRANRRLIEEQSKATPDPAPNPAPADETRSSQWCQRMRQRAGAAQVCSKCSQRLYPVDRMELDFTRQTLEIHRNCFKCQVCSTLLRLETYAAMDAKLYCPAHVREHVVVSKGPTGATC